MLSQGSSILRYPNPSDIAHTMQHWMTYQEFNKRLFEERYLAYCNGHSEKDPSDGWYKGELWFFDNYTLSLAQKLKSCDVFRVSHFEFISYAIQNRSEWAEKGQDIVAEMKRDCQARYVLHERSLDTSDCKAVRTS